MLPAVLLALVALAGVEIYVMVLIAQAIGAAWTIAALIASTAAGLWLARVQRRRASGALREAMQAGASPDRELGDAALIFAGGVLIALPGFVTDAVGLLAVAPVTRPAVRRLAGFLLRRRAAALSSRLGPPAGEDRGPQAEPGPPGKVVRGEVVDDGTKPER